MVRLGEGEAERELVGPEEWLVDVDGVEGDAGGLALGVRRDDREPRGARPAARRSPAAPPSRRRAPAGLSPGRVTATETIGVGVGDLSGGPAREVVDVVPRPGEKRPWSEAGEALGITADPLGCLDEAGPVAHRRSSEVSAHGGGIVPAGLLRRLHLDAQPLTGGGADQRDLFALGEGIGAGDLDRPAGEPAVQQGQHGEISDVAFVDE